LRLEIVFNDNPALLAPRFLTRHTGAVLASSGCSASQLWCALASGKSSHSYVRQKVVPFSCGKTECSLKGRFSYLRISFAKPASLDALPHIDIIASVISLKICDYAEDGTAERRDTAAETRSSAECINTDVLKSINGNFVFHSSLPINTRINSCIIWSCRG
jgi:hypothetical protein